ncbi:N-acetylmuramoyl-L-alanine amidase [Rhodospirillales bacterium]|nr:N-acetylmuramoyl-L-alanine amidase [Rhodospirillales bacterium]
MTRSPNFNDRDGVRVDMLVLHYTGMRTAQDALDRLCDPAAEVSAHFMIDEDGTLNTLVAEADRAWHAGIASWRGHSNINSRSIGIELVNPGHEFGYREFPESQINVLVNLCQGVLERHDIPVGNVVGHSDIAPSRKEDPGELFPWELLAVNGIGLWPFNVSTFDPISTDEVSDALVKIGYDVEDVDAAVSAFQRHFVTDSLDAGLDKLTRRSLAAVAAML